MNVFPQRQAIDALLVGQPLQPDGEAFWPLDVSAPDRWLFQLATDADASMEKIVLLGISMPGSALNPPVVVFGPYRTTTDKKLFEILLDGHTRRPDALRKYVVCKELDFVLFSEDMHSCRAAAFLDQHKGRPRLTLLSPVRSCRNYVLFNKTAAVANYVELV